MRHDSKATKSGRRWRIAFGVSLVFLVFAAVGPPPAWAQMIYRGGFIQTDRSPDPYASPPSAPRTRAASPPSYFPDNDADYPVFSAAAMPEPPPPYSALLPYNISPTNLPWNRAGFADYDEPLGMPQDVSLAAPTKYALETTALSSAIPAARPRSALLITYLPEHAVFWVEGTRTQSTGRTRYFQSPQLILGRKFGYTVRTAWIENGHWVSQTRLVPVQAGMVQAIYLRPAPATQTKTDREVLAQPTKAVMKPPAK
jgi:uncharacterized protein (TIGR03000 family)